MTIQVGARPAQLDGCFASWNESDVEVIARTDYESGNMRTRRRFTGQSKIVKASVTLPLALYTTFRDWYRINQRQGAIATKVKTPYGTEEVFQFTAPPEFSFGKNGTFTATVSLYQGSDF